MHATQLFLTSQGYPMLMSIVPHAWEKKLKKDCALFMSYVYLL